MICTCADGICKLADVSWDCENCEKTRFSQIYALRLLIGNSFLTIKQKEKKICQLGWELIGTELANYGFEKLTNSLFLEVDSIFWLGKFLQKVLTLKK